MKNREMIEVGIKFLSIEKDKDIFYPKYMTEFSSGMDICAVLEKSLIIEPGSIEIIPTGFAIELPTDFEAQIRPRSGLAAKYGIGILNSPGTIDADYRGEIKVILVNFGLNCFKISRGDRIAQMIFSKVYRGNLNVIKDFNLLTKRSFNGFGHTGRR